jgi:ribosomal protein S15P/S13E
MAQIAAAPAASPDWSFLDVDSGIEVRATEFRRASSTEDDFIANELSQFATLCARTIAYSADHYNVHPRDATGEPGVHYTRSQTRTLVAYMRDRGLVWDSRDVHGPRETAAGMDAWVAVLLKMKSVLLGDPDIVTMAASRLRIAMDERVVRVRQYIRHSSSAHTLPPQLLPQPETESVDDAYCRWRAANLAAYAFQDRVLCACTFVANHASICDPHVVSQSGMLSDDLRPWVAFKMRFDSGLGFRPIRSGAENRMVFRAKVACAEIMAGIAPRLLDYANFVPGSVLDELASRERERVAREAVSTVAMAELNYDHGIPLDLVNLIVGFVHPWRAGAPVMTPTPAQQAQRDAFAKAHGGS